jgi:hypothetical protein
MPTIAEMTALAAWAIAVINPINGRTAESGGTVHQIVADTDDLELALEVAATRGATPAELDDKRALIQEHAD